MELYPHNQEAYEKVMEAFKTQRKVAVVHATGTGKSYIIAKVVEEFGKCLIIAPNKYVLNETRKICKKGTEFMSYLMLTFHAEEMDTDYDLIVCDELHRTGATEWNKALLTLFERNLKAKILGTSANDVRYLDKNRDMVKELFDDNVASRLTLYDAISKGILPSPTYVCALYDIEESIQMFADKACEDELRQLKDLRYNWGRSNGVAQIMQKYLPKDLSRMIVFCSDIKSTYMIEKDIRKWLNDAGFANVTIMRVYGKNTMNDKTMKRFERDDNTLKVLLSVNMLNEGIHVHDVDAVMFLRTTQSRIIVEQQAGRCLTAANREKKPVILDFVNNVFYFNDEKTFNDAQEGQAIQVGKRKTAKDKEHKEYSFEIIDECKDIRDVLLQIHSRNTTKSTRNYWTYERIIESAKKYERISLWMQNERSAYENAKRLGIVKECTAHMKEVRRRWDKKSIKATTKGYTFKSDWRKNETEAYHAAQRMGITKEITSHLQNKKKWTDSDVFDSTQRYSSYTEWRENEKSLYIYAITAGLLDKVKKGFNSVSQKNRWTRRTIVSDACKYNSRNEWGKKGNKSYHAARRLNIIDDIANLLGWK